MAAAVPEISLPEFIAHKHAIRLFELKDRKIAICVNKWLRPASLIPLGILSGARP